VAAGNVSITVANASGTSSQFTVAARTFQPAFFEWGGYVVATVPAKPGETIVLWGTGFGPVAANTATVSVGGAAAVVSSVVLTHGFSGHGPQMSPQRAGALPVSRP
jgi:uncharacterized protein (TIGR03437 family)